ncbi:CPBP family intramembrane glutamic endopeptidase [Pseudonocardia endophytica]|uniref:CAAX prenyl protease-like protein n=1 Tax=Pseudonocardia endophytica TaxID=401976 RepID=A0A4R1HTH6_PSEEN|nr:CPBP family intramembrane glutamic endopeptidase [Pseudonocardia endophytica]TCK24623.1 CAAX prenyl protease-like protein [Pseudonocardia endophytica]
MSREAGEIVLNRAVRRRYGVVAAVAGVVIVALAMAWLLIHGITGVRVSADRADTEPVWWRWLPALAASLVVAMMPWRRDPIPSDVSTGELRLAVRGETLILAASAVAFTAALIAAGGAEAAHTGGKVLLLVILPLLTFRWFRSALSTRPPLPAAGPTAALAATAAVTVWMMIALLVNGPTWASSPAPAVPGAQLVIALIGGFILNAVVEEYFYRRWLQSRIEWLLGRWPGIVLATLLWSAWHAAIQGVGRLDLDLASVLVAHAATGVLLGLLWSRYRRMWPLLTVHGALNALPVLVSLLGAP